MEWFFFVLSPLRGYDITDDFLNGLVTSGDAI